VTVVGNDSSLAIAERLALDALDPGERATAVLYLDFVARPPGPVELPGPGTVLLRTSEPAFLAFVDRRPGANWMHDARYLVIEPGARSVRSAPAEGPPAYGPLPPGWRVVYRPDAVEEWRVLPLAAQPEARPEPQAEQHPPQETLEGTPSKEEPS
jgi:hypothetical protein